jgi:hypothetical protein
VLKILFCLRRNPALSQAEFISYWRDKHTPLVLARAEVLGIRRYVQNYSLDDAASARLSDIRGRATPFDGMAEVWWDGPISPGKFSDEESRAAQLELIEDERRFIDLPNSPIFIAKAHERYRHSSYTEGAVPQPM